MSDFKQSLENFLNCLNASIEKKKKKRITDLEKIVPVNEVAWTEHFFAK